MTPSVVCERACVKDIGIFCSAYICILATCIFPAFCNYVRSKPNGDDNSNSSSEV